MLEKMKEERDAKTEEGAMQAVERATNKRSNKRLTLAATSRMRAGEGENKG